MLFGTTAADMAREYVFASIQRHAALEPAPEPRPMPPAPTMEPPMPFTSAAEAAAADAAAKAAAEKAPGGVVPQPDSGVLVAWTDTPLGELEVPAHSRAVDEAAAAANRRAHAYLDAAEARRVAAIRGVNALQKAKLEKEHHEMGMELKAIEAAERAEKQARDADQEGAGAV